MNNQGDLMESLMPLILLILVWAGLWWFYTENASVINAGSLMLSEAVLYPFSFFSSNAAHSREIISHINPSRMHWHEVTLVIGEAGRYFRWIVTPLLVWIAYLGYMKGQKKWTRKFDFKGLIENNIETFPSIAPAVRADILSMHQRHGPWRMADSPIKWSIEHGVIGTKVGDKIKRLDLSGVFDLEGDFPSWDLHRKSMRHYDNKATVFLKGRATKAFKEQLGAPVPSNLLAMPDYVKGLLAGFLLFLHGDRKEAYAFLAQLSLSYEGENEGDPSLQSVTAYSLDITGADDIITQHKDLLLLPRIAVHNYYMTTLLAATLQVSRDSGELAPGRFIWLRPVDRTLWYTLNQLGGRMPLIEAAGVDAHMKAERILDTPLFPAEVDDAVNGLEVDLKKEKWLKKDEE